MKKSTVPVIAILAIAIVAVVILIGRSKSQVIVEQPTLPTQTVQPTQTTLIGETSPTTQPSEPTKLTPTTIIIQPPKFVQCTTPECLFPHFLKCNPVELKMPFSGGTIYQITVFGIKDGKCHYATKIVDSSGKTVSVGPPPTECFMPIDKITTATIEHLFGVDAVAGKETIKAEQDQLFVDYCSQ